MFFGNGGTIIILVSVTSTQGLRGFTAVTAPLALNPPSVHQQERTTASRVAGDLVYFTGLQRE